VVKSSARVDEGTRFNVAMMLVLSCERFNGMGPSGSPLINCCTSGLGLVRISSGAPLSDNVAMAEHNHARGDAKRARHVMRYHNRGHAGVASEF
jgi:hypothetical protein